MAQGISLISGSPFIGNPIVLQVTPESYSQSRTFHRSIVRVYAKLETDDDYTTFDFSTPVETKVSGASYINIASQFDISSALQAVADKYEYEPAPTFPKRYPYIKYRVEAWDEWMVDGSIYKEQGRVYYPGVPYGGNDLYAYALMGSFTDVERMSASSETSAKTGWLTRKPMTVEEIAFQSEPIILPKEWEWGVEADFVRNGNFCPNPPSSPYDYPDKSGPKSERHTFSDTGIKAIANYEGGETRRVYVIPKPQNGYVFRFINGQGVMESVHIISLTEKKSNVKTEQYVISRSETFKKFSRGLTRKTNDYEMWSFTTGPLDEAWASWYVHEFLMARWIWIKIDTLWVPCQIAPEETVLISDKTKVGMIEVHFSVQISIQGSLIKNQ